MFSWANKQLERLAETIAPMSSSDPGHQFMSALNNGDQIAALAYLNGSNSEDGPVDPHGLLNATKGTQPIHLACQNNAMQVVLALLNEYGARADSFDYLGNTALHYAAMSTVKTQSTGPVDLVKMLVTEYGASVIVKNGSGQTPYDVSTDTMVRQYLLPLQLQQETQACFDNGGKGLPPGIDMGGFRFSNNIAPPPSAVNGGLSPTQFSPPPISSSPGTHFAPPPISTTNGTSPPVQFPPPATNYFSPTPTSSTTPTTPNTHFTPPPISTNLQSNQAAASNHFSSPPLSAMSLTPQNDQPAETSHFTPPPISTTPETPQEYDSVTETTTMSPAPLSNITQTEATVPAGEETNQEATTAPFPNSTAFPPPPVTANLQPMRTFRKPDGFHSSSSDPNLQKKYGHIKAQVTVQQPPPTSTGTMMHPPPIMNHTRTQNRYLAYDAVSGTASTLQSKFPPPPIHNRNGSAQQPPPNFSVFNPGAQS